MMHVLLQRMQVVTPRMTTYWFTRPANFGFTPGEYIEVYLPHASPDNRGEHRKFSISSAPHEPLLGLTISMPESYPSSFKAALAQFRAGDSLEISEPIGDFVLPKMETIPVIGLALGSGITPFMSITSHLAHTKSNRPFRLFHAAATFDDIPTLAVPTIPVLSKPSSSWTGLNGRITAQDIIATCAPSEETLFYLSGPAHSVNIVREGLLEAGIHTRQVVSDPFLGAKE